MALQINIVLAGLAAGAIYALLALSYNVIFATTGVLNFAQGELFMVGTMMGWYFSARLGWPVPVALVATVLSGAAIGAAEEYFAVRPSRRRGRGAFGWVLSTLGVAIVLRSGFALAFGTETQSLNSVVPDKPITVGDVLLQPEHLLLIGLAVAMTGILYVFYTRSLGGRALSAVEVDADAAALRGIPVGLLSTLSFAIGGGLAALTGFFAAPLTGAYPTIGLLFALKGFVASAVGGIPDVRGALVGGLLLGIVEAFSIDRIGAGYRNAAVFAVLLLILAVRPAGLIGRRAVRAV